MCPATSRRTTCCAPAPRAARSSPRRGAVGVVNCRNTVDWHLGHSQGRRHRIVEELLGAARHADHRGDVAGTLLVCHRALSVRVRDRTCKMRAARRSGSPASRESHAVLHLPHRLARNATRRRRAITGHLVHDLRLRANLRGARANRRQLRVDVLEQHLLALDASPPRRPTLRLHVRRRRRAD